VSVSFISGHVLRHFTSGQSARTPRAYRNVTVGCRLNEIRNFRSLDGAAGAIIQDACLAPDVRLFIANACRRLKQINAVKK